MSEEYFGPPLGYINRMTEPVNIEHQVRQLARTDTQLSVLQRTKKELRDELFAHVVKHGTTDANGHSLVTFDEAIEGITALKIERRRSRSLDATAAERILRDLDLWEECTEMIAVLDEDKLMAAVFEGRIDEELVDEMYPATVTEAFVPVRPRRK